MAHKKETETKEVKLVDIFVLFASFSYFHSVLSVAHHTAFWPEDDITRIVESPAVPVLVFGLVLAAYSIYKAKGKVSTLLIIALTIFATSSLFWLSGLRTNFY